MTNKEILNKLKSLAKKESEETGKSFLLDDLLTSLVRPILCAEPGHKFVICDVAQIEARMLAWMTGDPNTELFREGKDVYSNLATQIYGYKVNKKDHPNERFVGKQGELLLGYGGGGPKFYSMCLAQGYDITTMGITNPTEQVVYKYRDLHPAIAGTWSGEMWTPPGKELPIRIYRNGFWKDIQKAMKRVVAGDYTTAKVGENDCVELAKDGSDAIMVLPSGRAIVYRDARIEPYESFGEVRDNQIVFTKFINEKSELRVSTYGGKLTENADQGACWDILNEIHIEMEESGYEVVLEVHDELVLQVPENKAEEVCVLLTNRMATPPLWAPGIPMAAEGFVADYYCKSPRDGWFTYEKRGV